VTEVDWGEIRDNLEIVELGRDPFPKLKATEARIAFRSGPPEKKRRNLWTKTAVTAIIILSLILASWFGFQNTQLSMEEQRLNSIADLQSEFRTIHVTQNVTLDMSPNSTQINIEQLSVILTGQNLSQINTYALSIYINSTKMSFNSHGERDQIIMGINGSEIPIPLQTNGTQTAQFSYLTTLSTNLDSDATLATIAWTYAPLHLTSNRTSLTASSNTKDTLCLKIEGESILLPPSQQTTTNFVTSTQTLIIEVIPLQGDTAYTLVYSTGS